MIDFNERLETYVAASKALARACDLLETNGESLDRVAAVIQVKYATVLSEHAVVTGLLATAQAVIAGLQPALPREMLERIARDCPAALPTIEILQRIVGKHLAERNDKPGRLN
jgi:uncharacterized membrane protein